MRCCKALLNCVSTSSLSNVELEMALLFILLGLKKVSMLLIAKQYGVLCLSHQLRIYTARRSAPFA